MLKIKRTMPKTIWLLLIVGFAGTAPPAVSAPDLPARVNFMGINFCARLGGGANPHEHPEWQRPRIVTETDEGAGSAVHEFKYGQRVGSVKIEETGVSPDQCKGLPLDRITFDEQRRSTFCLSSLGRSYAVKMTITANATSLENADGMLGNFYGINACRIGNNMEPTTYIDGSSIKIGPLLEFNLPRK